MLIGGVSRKKEFSTKKKEEAAAVSEKAFLFSRSMWCVK
jgi:hypothetical protein